MEARSQNGVKRMSVYSVWVGGGEINAHYLSKSEAERIANAWKAKGYHDVLVQEITND